MERRWLHKLETIIAITLAAIICGAESCYDIADFGKRKKEWLGLLPNLSGGSPSHDTSNRFLAMAESATLENHFREWVYSLASTLKDCVVNIDGKYLR